MESIIAETERLTLRRFQASDHVAMECVFCDPEVMRFSSGVRSQEWVRVWISQCLHNYQQLGFGLWAVVDRMGRETLGYCGLSRFDDVGRRQEIEVGYRLARDYWGCGFATEAARAVREYGFRALNLPRLVSIIDPQNTASIRVAEKIEMRFERKIVFKGFDAVLYAINRPTD